MGSGYSIRGLDNGIRRGVSALSITQIRVTNKRMHQRYIESLLYAKKCKK